MAEPNWNNRTLFVADNIRILRGMNSKSVDCIATDPPFNKKRIFNGPLGSRRPRSALGVPGRIHHGPAWKTNGA